MESQLRVPRADTEAGNGPVARDFQDFFRLALLLEIDDFAEAPSEGGARTKVGLPQPMQLANVSQLQQIGLS